MPHFLHRSYSRAGGLRRIVGILLVISVLIALVPSTVLAIPQIPMQFYGDVIIGGLPAPDGVEIEARIGGISYITTTTKDGQYGYDPVFLVPADDPDTPAVEGGVEGDSVVLYVGGVMEAVAQYAYGASVNVGLSVDSLPGPSAPVNLTRITASNDNTPAFTWETPEETPGAIASYEINMDSAGWTDIGNVLTYTHSTALSDGNHTLQLRPVDKLGTKGDIASIEFVVDTTAPNTPTNVTKTTADNDNTPGFTWQAPTDEYSVVADYQVRIDTGDWVSIGNVTSYTHTEAVSDGSHAFTVRAIDSAGNTGDAVELSFTIDITPPSAPGGLTRTSAYNDDTPSFGWTASTDATSGLSSYEVRIDDGDWVDAGGVDVTYTWPSELSDGSHIFYVRAIDGAGNKGRSTYLAFAISSTTLPTAMSITRTSSDRNNLPIFTWGLVAGAVTYEVKKDSGAWSDIGNVTNYTYTSAVTEGGHLIQVRAVSSEGNTVSSGSLVFVIDAVSPSAPSSLEKTTPNSNNTPTFSWTASTDVTTGVATYQIRMDRGLWVDTGGVALTHNYSTVLDDGSHIFEVRAVDTAGNRGEAGSLDFYIDTAAPEVMVLSPNGGECWAGGAVHRIEWSTIDGNKGTVKLEYSVDAGITWTSIASGVTDIGTYLWTVPETDTTRARIRVTATDYAGSIDIDTSDASFTIDSTSPSIEDVVPLQVTVTGAVISWNSSEPATTQVEYGTTTEYGLITLLDTTLATSHVVTITGLNPGIDYHYRVKSVDAAGNIGVSADQTFTTAQASETITISDIAVSGVTTSSAVVSWTTNTPADSQVEYGLTDTYGMCTLRDTTTSISHSISITGLLSGTTYHYRVKSDGAVSEDGTFTTLVDSVFPIISNVDESGITVSRAVVSWNTSEPADSRVEYGTVSANHGEYSFASSLNTAMVVYRSVGLVGLTANTPYYYRVISSDAAGNETVSDEYSFTTLPDSTPPAISDITVTGKTTDSAVVSWITGEIATGQVEYGLSSGSHGNYDSTTTLNTTLSLGHSAGMGGLLPDTIYYYRVISADAVGNQTVSDECSFTTLPDTVEPVISDIVVTNVSGSGAIVVWVTDENATTEVVYDTTSHASYTDYVSSAPFSADTTADSLGHGVVLSGLVADTTYYCRIVSVDSYGNRAVSDEFSFITEDITPPAISWVSAVAITSTGAVISWVTDENATTQVEYGTVSAVHGGYEFTTSLDSSLLASHATVLMGLVPGTPYYYRVVSMDASGNEQVSLEYSFTTTPG